MDELVISELQCKNFNKSSEFFERQFSSDSDDNEDFDDEDQLTKECQQIFAKRVKQHSNLKNKWLQNSDSQTSSCGGGENSHITSSQCKGSLQASMDTLKKEIVSNLLFFTFSITENWF